MKLKSILLSWLFLSGVLYATESQGPLADENSITGTTGIGNVEDAGGCAVPKTALLTVSGDGLGRRLSVNTQGSSTDSSRSGSFSAPADAAEEGDQGACKKDSSDSASSGAGGLRRINNADLRRHNNMEAEKRRQEEADREGVNNTSE